jgi:hypothetical protein
MVSMMSLWMPIVLSAVAVFIVSSVIHMALPYHKSDYAGVPSEDAVMDALRKFNIPPGDYTIPRAASMADMKSPGFTEKWNRGPVAMITVFPPGPMAMGAQLTQWFVYSLVAGVFAAYVTSRAVVPGGPYLEVFRFAGVTAFACYGVALWQDSIWYKRKWSTTLKSTFDALLYAAVTAGVFGWLWPN